MTLNAKEMQLNSLSEFLFKQQNTVAAQQQTEAHIAACPAVAITRLSWTGITFIKNALVISESTIIETP